MEKRAHQRVNTIIAARFSGDSSYYANCLGTIMNISTNGMRVESCKCLPVNANATLLLFSIDQVLHVPFKVVRIINKSNFYSAMGIEVMQATPEYLELVEGLMSTNS